MAPNKDAIAAMKALQAQKDNDQKTLEKVYMNTDSPESRAMGIIGSMLTEFKVGEPDGLSLKDIKDSYNQLSGYLTIKDKDASDVNVLDKMVQALQLYGDKNKADRAEREERRLGQAEQYQQATQSARDAAAMKDAKFKDLHKISIGELYAEAMANGGKLFAKSFIPAVWAAVVKYRDLVHKLIVMLHQENPDIDDDSDYLENSESKATEILFMNPLAEMALAYGPIEKFKMGCEYADVSEAEASRLEYAGITCFVKIGPSNAERDGFYATSGGMSINDGTQSTTIVEEFLGAGLAVAVKCPVDPKTKRIVYSQEAQTIEPYGSLFLEPYAISYTTASVPDNE